MTDYDTRRDAMVRTQIAQRGVSDERVLAAMRAVPRELFVGEGMGELAYEDTPLPIGEGQTISQPYIVAAMIEAAAIGPGDRALEIGAGCGYAAAVMARVADHVFAIERHAPLVALARSNLAHTGTTNVSLREGDGTLGWAEEAPFEAIVVSAGAPRVPDALKRQLAIGGRLVIPVGEGPQTLVRFSRTGDNSYETEELARVRFVPLVGSGTG